MNRNVLTVLIILGVAILGIGGYMIFGNKANVVTPPVDSTARESQPLMGGAKSLKDLLTGGQPQTCTFQDAETSGTVFVGGGKMRGDFVSTVDGVQTGSHVMVDGQTFYTWTEGQNQGIKMEFDPSEATPGAQANMPKDGIDPDKKVDYSCSGWSLDPGKFALPTDVTFSDLNEMMVPKGADIKDAKTQQCAACNSLSGDAAAQCKKALGC